MVREAEWDSGLLNSLPSLALIWRVGVMDSLVHRVESPDIEAAIYSMSDFR